MSSQQVVNSRSLKILGGYFLRDPILIEIIRRVLKNIKTNHK
jgi:hypothetical protein